MDKTPRGALIGCVRRLTSRSRAQCITSTACWSSVWIGTKRGQGRLMFAALDVLEGRIIGPAIRSSFASSMPSGPGAGRKDGSCHPRQLRHPQTPEGQRMAHPAPEVRLPLHPDLVLVAQRSRDFLRQAHQTALETGRLPIDRRPPARHHASSLKPIMTRGDSSNRRPQQHHRRRQTRAPSVRFDPLASSDRINRSPPQSSTERRIGASS
jgi:hypothetical protein